MRTHLLTLDPGPEFRVLVELAQRRPTDPRSDEMTSEPTPARTPIACDMTGAPDTVEERMAEYGRLFAQAFTGRERTDAGVRLRFRAEDGVEAWVRDLAAREKACCLFYDFAVSTTGGEVRWDAGLVEAVADDDIARAVLDEFYNLPDTVADGVAGVERQLNERGVAVTTNEAGTVMRFHHASADA
jgi:hypothetical protein